MILHLMLIVFVVIMTIISIGLTIGGLIKKKRKLWIISLSLTVLFLMLTVFSIVTYIKKTVDYMGTEEFQEETKKKAENLGKTWGNTVSGTAKGLDESIDDEILLGLANKGAKILGGGAKTIASGFDETTGKTTIFPSESLDSLGIKIGRAERIKDSLKISYGLFLEFENSYNGVLELTAYDDEGLKMDKAILDVNEKANSSKVFVFQFDYFKPGLSGYCILSNRD